MGSINTDIAQTLDITCRRGDTLALDITFRDSSTSDNAFIPIDSGYEFNMDVRTTASDNSSSPILSDENSPGTGTAGIISLDALLVGQTESSGSLSQTQLWPTFLGVTMCTTSRPFRQAQRLQQPGSKVASLSTKT